MITSLNLVLRFVLELTGIAAASYAGYHLGVDPLRLVFALASAAALIALWATLVAPRSASPLSPSARRLLGTALLLVAAAALATTGQAWAAAAFAALVVLNETTSLLGAELNRAH